MDRTYRYAYVHGFASGSASNKGLHLQAALRRHGAELELPDLNVPGFETMTYSSILEALNAIDAAGPGDRRWRLIGSSMGGYLTARWAELHPERVDRVVLLCPGFDMASRWPRLLGEAAVRRWRADGYLELPDATGTMRPVHWGLLEDARSHPPFPELPCPGLILHGTRDEVVDPDVSRIYASLRPNVQLVELDDDHGLAASLDRVAEETLAFFGLA